MRAVLDTSVVIATDVPALPGELAISSATVAELHLGVDTYPWRKPDSQRLIARVVPE